MKKNKLLFLIPVFSTLAIAASFGGAYALSIKNASNAGFDIRTNTISKVIYRVYWASWNLGNDDAKCWVWVWGGSAQFGEWVEGTWGGPDGSGKYCSVFNTYADATGCKCVRFKNNITQPSWNENDYWNITGNVDISGDNYNIYIV